MVIHQLLQGWDAWSREYCVAICSTFVPLMLLLTGATVLGLWFPSQRRWMTLTASWAGGCALLLCLHVLSWFHVGVVHPVTFILAGMSLFCGTVNLGAVWWGRTRLALSR